MLSELESSLLLFYTGISRDSSAIIQEQVGNARRQNTDSIEAMHELKREHMKECLLKGDIPGFARYLGRSLEAKKRMSHKISNAALYRVMDRARAAGAIAGKVSGAGGGGFITFVVDPPRRPAAVRALEQESGRVTSAQVTKLGTQGWRV